MNVNRKLKHSATWWAATPDGYGGNTFVAPVLIKCRWEDNQQLLRDTGTIITKEQSSQAVVFVDRAVSIGDYLCKGDLTASADPTAVQGAYPVQNYGKVTDLRDVDVLHKAVL